MHHSPPLLFLDWGRPAGLLLSPLHLPLLTLSLVTFRVRLGGQAKGQFRQKNL